LERTGEIFQLIRLIDALTEEKGPSEAFEDFRNQDAFLHSSLGLVLTNFHDFFVNAKMVNKLKLFPAYGKRYVGGSTYRCKWRSMSVITQLRRDKTFYFDDSEHVFQNKVFKSDQLVYYRNVAGKQFGLVYFFNVTELVPEAT
jgi:hypothetical protein